MNVTIREYHQKDLAEMVYIWNEVIEDGIAFPQENCLNENTGKECFEAQTYSAVAVDESTDQLLGLYILHPNNIGRCAHIANASYAVKKNTRGLHIG